MEKINIAELLKDCPKGMELYSPIFGEVYLDKIRPHLAIVVTTNKERGDIKEEFFYDGRYGINGECMLFPSKDQQDWSKFQRPFKDGDAVTYKLRGSLIAFIYKERTSTMLVKSHFALYANNMVFCIDGDIALKEEEIVFATKEEKQKLFDAIKANGYEWNAETKTLEKLPKVKVGDKITDKNKFIYRITEITDKGYKLHDLKDTFITFEDADLLFVKVMDIFDINSLIPFESRVLVRSSFGDIWRPAIYGFTNSKKHYIIGGSYWMQCIPYEANKELLGTTNDCDDFYKTWE